MCIYIYLYTLFGCYWSFSRSNNPPNLSHVILSHVVDWCLIGLQWLRSCDQLVCWCTVQETFSMCFFVCLIVSQNSILIIYILSWQTLSMEQRYLLLPQHLHCYVNQNQGIKPLMLYKLYNGPWRLDVWGKYFVLQDVCWKGFPRSCLFVVVCFLFRVDVFFVADGSILSFRFGEIFQNDFECSYSKMM